MVFGRNAISQLMVELESAETAWSVVVLIRLLPNRHVKRHNPDVYDCIVYIFGSVYYVVHMYYHDSSSVSQLIHNHIITDYSDTNTLHIIANFFSPIPRHLRLANLRALSVTCWIASIVLWLLW